MAYEFKKLSDVNAIEAVSANTNVLVEENGEIVKVAANNFVSDNTGGVSSWNDLTDKPFGDEYVLITTATEENTDEWNEDYITWREDNEAYNTFSKYVRDGKKIKITLKYQDEQVISYEDTLFYDEDNYVYRAGEADLSIKGYVFEFDNEQNFEAYLGFSGGTILEAKVEIMGSKLLDIKYLPRIMPIVPSVSAGQTVVVKSIGDGHGKPIEWEAIDLAWDSLKNKPFGEEIKSVILAEENLEFWDYVEGNNTYFRSLSTKDEDAYSSIDLNTEIYAELNDGESVQNYIKELTFDHPYTGISQTYWYIGNPGYFAGPNYNDESEGSFAIAFFDNGMQIFIPEDIGTAYVKVSAFTSSVQTIPEKFIPSTVPVIQSAVVGQTIAVKAVDENGKPTEWEVVDVITEARVNELIAAALNIPNAEEASF